MTRRETQLLALAAVCMITSLLAIYGMAQFALYD